MGIPLVGLMGAKGSGKDTAAAALTVFGWEFVAFAGPLKSMAYAIDPVVRVPAGVSGRWPAGAAASFQDVVGELTMDVAKNLVPDVRRFLQRLGSEGVRDHLGEGAWVDLAMARYRSSTKAGVAITDVRFPNEADAILAAGGLLVRVLRPSLVGGDSHRSETSTSCILDDLTLVNDTTVEALQDALVTGLGDLGLLGRQVSAA